MRSNIFGALLGIRDTLVRVRIRLLSSVTTGTLPSVLVKSLILCKNFVLIFYFASIILVRSTHLREKGRIRIRIRTSDYLIRIREAQKHADPQHCTGMYLFNRGLIFNIFAVQITRSNS
jgi:hypothetical protein